MGLIEHRKEVEEYMYLWFCAKKLSAQEVNGIVMIDLRSERRIHEYFHW